MGIIIGIVVLLIVLVFIGNSKRVEREEITEEESFKVNASNISRGLSSGLNEVNSFMDKARLKIEIKRAVMAFQYGALILEEIISTVKEYGTNGRGTLNLGIDNSQKERAESAFAIDYENVCQLIASLPKEDRAYYQLDLDAAYNGRDAKLAELKELSRDDGYKQAVYMASKPYESESLFALLDLGAQSR